MFFRVGPQFTGKDIIFFFCFVFKRFRIKLNALARTNGGFFFLLFVQEVYCNGFSGRTIIKPFGTRVNHNFTGNVCVCVKERQRPNLTKTRETTKNKFHSRRTSYIYRCRITEGVLRARPLKSIRKTLYDKSERR